MTTGRHLFTWDTCPTCGPHRLFKAFKCIHCGYAIPFITKALEELRDMRWNNAITSITRGAQKTQSLYAIRKEDGTQLTKSERQKKLREAAKRGYNPVNGGN